MNINHRPHIWQSLGENDAHIKDWDWLEFERGNIFRRVEIEGNSVRYLIRSRIGNMLCGADFGTESLLEFDRIGTT
jgi:hypothetical protein